MVLDCAVVRIPYDQLGEVLALFVVPRVGQTIEVDMLLTHCHASPSSYKVPHVVHMTTEIPRTGSGKIVRYKLRESVQA